MDARRLPVVASVSSGACRESSTCTTSTLNGGDLIGRAESAVPLGPVRPQPNALVAVGYGLVPHAQRCISRAAVAEENVVCGLLYHRI